MQTKFAVLRAHETWNNLWAVDKYSSSLVATTEFSHSYFISTLEQSVWCLPAPPPRGEGRAGHIMRLFSIYQCSELKSGGGSFSSFSCGKIDPWNWWVSPTPAIITTCPITEWGSTCNRGFMWGLTQELCSWWRSALFWASHFQNPALYPHGSWWVGITLTRDMLTILTQEPFGSSHIFSFLQDVSSMSMSEKTRRKLANVQKQKAEEEEQRRHLEERETQRQREQEEKRRRQQQEEREREKQRQQEKLRQLGDAVENGYEGMAVSGRNSNSQNSYSPSSLQDTQPLKHSKPKMRTKV